MSAEEKIGLFKFSTLAKMIAGLLRFKPNMINEIEFIFNSCPPMFKYQRRFLHIGKLRPPLFHKALLGTFFAYLKGLAGSKIMIPHTRAALKQFNLSKVVFQGTTDNSSSAAQAKLQLVRLTAEMLVEAVVQALRNGYIPIGRTALTHEVSDEIKRTTCETL